MPSIDLEVGDVVCDMHNVTLRIGELIGEFEGVAHVTSKYC